MRALRVIGWVLVGLVGLVVVVVGGAWITLHTSFGGERVRRIAVAKVNEQIAGKITADRLELEGLGFTLTGVRLVDPAGGEVARVRRVRLAVAIGPLLRRRVVVRAVEIDDPTARIVQDENGGSNLARALTPRNPSPAKPKRQPSNDDASGTDLTIALERLAIRGGDVELRGPADGEAPPLHVHVRDFAVDAHGDVDLRDGRFDVDARLGAQLLEPFRTELAAELGGDGQRDQQSGRVALTVGDGRLVANATRAKNGSIEAHVRRLRVTPTLACLGRKPCFLAGPIDGAADVTLDGNQVGSASVQLAASDGGTVKLRGRFDVRRKRVHTLDVQGRELDVARIVTGGPRSNLDLDVTAEDVALGPDTWRGRATVSIPPGVVAGRRFGPVDVRAEARSRDDATATARAILPGAKLDARAAVTAGALSAEGKLALSSIEALVAALAPAAARGPGAPRGQANVAFRAAGRMDRFDATVDANVPRFQSGTLRVSGVRASARLPAAPNYRTGRVSVDVASLASGKTDFGRVQLTANAAPEGARGTKLAVRAAIAKPEKVSLAADGALVDERRARVDRLTLSYPGVTWQSDGTNGPARITFGDGDLRVAGFAIASGDQRIALDLHQRGARRDARVRVTAFDLAKLPKIVQQPGKSLGGRVDVDVDLGGTQRRPSLTVRTKGEKLAMGPRRFGDVTAELDAPRTAPLSAKVDWSYGPKPLKIEVRTPFILGDLMADSPAVAIRRAIRDRRPFGIDAELERFPLALLDELAGRTVDDRGRPKRREDALHGEASLRAKLAGPLLAPVGQLALELRGVAKEGIPPTDADVTIDARSGSMEVKTSVTRRDTKLVDATLAMNLPAQPPRDLDGALALPVKLDARVGPVKVQRLGLVAPDRRRAPRTLHGVLHASLSARGTLGDPRIEIAARTDGLALDDEALGTVRLNGSWKGREARLDLDAASSQNGSFAISARADAGAKLGALIKRPPEPATIPFRVSVLAKQFDLSWASGLVRKVPTLAGKVNANMEASGPIDRLRAKGSMALDGGEATLVGFGRFKNIRARVSGDERSVKLDELYLESGGGRGTIKARLDRPSNGVAKMTADADLKDFLVKSEGQDLGALTLRASVKGGMSGQAITIDPLTIDEAHFAVSSGRRKNLQPLAEPKDVVLFRDGKPLNAHQARKLAALQAQDALASENLASGEQTEAPMTVKIRIKAPRNLWARAEDATIEVGLSDDFRVHMDPTTRVFGQVFIRRAQVKLLGRRFNVDKESSVTFGGQTMAPRFDLTARHKSEQANVTVIAKLSGTPETPKLTLTSDPPYPETAIVSLLVTGRLDLDQRSGAAASGGSKAASLLGGFLASRLQQTLGKRLPLDVLTIEPGQSPGSAYLEAGTYLTDDLYVAYVGRLGADPTRYQNRNLVHLEYQLTPRWSFEGEYGDARTGSADVTWRKRY